MIPNVNASTITTATIINASTIQQGIAFISTENYVTGYINNLTNAGTINKGANWNANYQGRAGIGGNVPIPTQARDTSITFYIGNGVTVNNFYNTGTIQNTLLIDGQVNTLTNRGSIGTITVNNAMTSFTNAGTLSTLTLNAPVNNLFVNANTITTLNLNVANAINIAINQSADNYNTTTNTTGHLNAGTINIAQGLTGDNAAIVINAAAGMEANKIYSYKALFGNNATIKSGNENITVSSYDYRANPNQIFKYLRIGTQGVDIVEGRDTNGDSGLYFGLIADDSYGAAILKALSLIHLRREVLINEVLDSVTTNNFHSGYTEHREDRLEEINKILANPKGVSKEKLVELRIEKAKLDRQYSKSQRLDEKYNRQTLFDALDKVFVPYQGERKLMSFITPYTVGSSLRVNGRPASEFGGGMIGGIQAKLGKGVLGGHLGYEYDTAKADLTTTSADMTSSAVFFGLNYYRPFAKVDTREYYFKIYGRGSVVFPKFGVYSPLTGGTVNLNLTSYSGGIEGTFGANFYFLSNFTYISPEISLSYDELGLNAFSISQTGESYPNHLFHLPQLGAHFKWYRAWGRSFRTSARVGAKYNILNQPEVRFSFLGASAKGSIDLPIIYGTLDVSVIYAFAKRQQISLGYNGIYYSEGISNAGNLRWQMWF